MSTAQRGTRTRFKAQHNYVQHFNSAMVGLRIYSPFYFWNLDIGTLTVFIRPIGFSAVGNFELPSSREGMRMNTGLNRLGLIL